MVAVGLGLAAACMYEEWWWGRKDGFPSGAIKPVPVSGFTLSRKKKVLD
jgi:hypothetical protein